MVDSKHQLKDRSGEEVRHRKIKMAESGILFVLVVGICVYLGIRFAHDPLDESGAEVLAISEQLSGTVLHGGKEPAVRIASAVSHAIPPSEARDDGRQADSLQITAPAPGSDTTVKVLPAEPVRVSYTRAEKTYFEGRYTEAAELFAAYCDHHPGNTWGHYMRGLSLWKADRPGEAHGAFETALRLQPDHLKSLINLARVELELDEAHAALTTIEKALDVAPHDAEALRVLGRIYHRLDRVDEAMSTYHEALRRRADDPWTLNNLGLLHIQMETFDRALPVLARARELAPDAAVIRNNLGTALERTGHLSQALVEFEYAHELGSGHGRKNYARLDAVVIPANDPAADLKALAAAWSGSLASRDGLAVVHPAGRSDGQP